MPPEIEIKEPKILVVEGYDDQRLISALINKIDIPDIQIIILGGINNLRPYLNALVISPGFQDIVQALGIVRDADDNSLDKLHSVQDALQAAKLPVPDRPLQPAGRNPKTAILILPHDKQGGALEDVCLASVEADAVINCVEEYMDCVQEKVETPPNNVAKAKVQTFLASRIRPGLRLGEAAEADYWDLNHSSFEPLKEFLHLL
ncbi:MAG: hypothetical protein IH861_09370 [Chloroflexi bacterium]|nr:hypothetical protein [Chloroflexota bacterium]